jgi:hypothetical protein
MPLEIPLTRGYAAIIDSEDYEKVMACSENWQALVLPGGLIYAKTDKRYGPRWQNRKKCTYLHALVLDRAGFNADRLEISHEDCDGLNCQKYNLKVVTHAENLRNRRRLQPNNTSGVAGVSWHSARRKWCAEIHFDGKKYYLGLYDTIEAATAARAEKERELCHQIPCP